MGGGVINVNGVTAEESGHWGNIGETEGPK